MIDITDAHGRPVEEFAKGIVALDPRIFDHARLALSQLGTFANARRQAPPRTFSSLRAFKGGKASAPGAALVEEANLLTDLSENEGGLLPVFAS